jgi:hypothetical protein
MKALILGLLIIPALAQTPPPVQPAAPAFTKMEQLEFKNVQNEAQIAQDLGVQIIALQQKQRETSTQQTADYSALKADVEADHPGFTLDNFGNIISKAAANAPHPPVKPTLPSHPPAKK